MTGLATREELDAMIRVARRAQALVMEIYATDFVVELKGKDDPVTLADKEANSLICDTLTQAFPDHGVIGEESGFGPEALAMLTSRERVFYVDPVDGTREFAERTGEFCVMIGLSIGGRAAAGVIAIPVEKKLFHGSVGTGAFLEAADGTVRPLTLTPLTDPRESRAVVSRSHMSKSTRAIVEALHPKRTIPTGSVGVKAARLLEGTADVYVHASYGAKKWDACAPDGLVRAADGLLCDLDGRDIDYADPELSVENGIVAASRTLLPRVLETIRATLKR